MNYDPLSDKQIEVLLKQFLTVKAEFGEEKRPEIDDKIAELKEELQLRRGEIMFRYAHIKRTMIKQDPMVIPDQFGRMCRIWWIYEGYLDEAKTKKQRFAYTACMTTVGVESFEATPQPHFNTDKIYFDLFNSSWKELAKNFQQGKALWNVQDMLMMEDEPQTTPVFGVEALNYPIPEEYKDVLSFYLKEGGNR